MNKRQECCACIQTLAGEGMETCDQLKTLFERMCIALGDEPRAKGIKEWWGRVSALHDKLEKVHQLATDGRYER